MLPQPSYREYRLVTPLKPACLNAWRIILRVLDGSRMPPATGARSRKSAPSHPVGDHVTNSCLRLTSPVHRDPHDDRGAESHLWHLNTKEAAEVLGTAPRNLYKLVELVKAPAPHKDPDDHRIYWRCVDLLAWLDQRRDET
jgi:hypothetical protein